MRFWDIVKEVSAQAVQREAEQQFMLAIAGHPQEIEAALRQITGDGTVLIPDSARPFLLAASPPYDEVTERRLRHADILVSLPGGPALNEMRPARVLQVAWGGNLIPVVLQVRPDLRVALGRRFPGFRVLASECLIREIALVNAEFTAVSGISQAIPVLLPLFPAMVGADLLVLTKNQIMMLFRLAAIHGESYRLQDRIYELLPLLGGALGWRGLARQLTGLIPAAAGLPLRIGVAYSGTYVTGRTAQLIFQTGRKPTRAELREIANEAARLARETAGRIRALRKKDPPAGPALPEPAALPEEVMDESRA